MSAVLQTGKKEQESIGQPTKNKEQVLAGPLIGWQLGAAGQLDLCGDGQLRLCGAWLLKQGCRLDASMLEVSRLENCRLIAVLGPQRLYRLVVHKVFICMTKLNFCYEIEALNPVSHNPQEFPWAQILATICQSTDGGTSSSIYTIGTWDSKRLKSEP